MGASRERHVVPRLSALKLEALNEVASQLRYVPTKRTLEQLAQIVALASEVDVNQLYPEDWLVQRLTGYRPEIEEPTMIVGGALLGDLSALAEHLSDQARLEIESLSSETISLEELTARWSVSARTIERYRRDGLIALRVLVDGRSRLAFAMESVEAFERTNEKTIGAATKRTRIGRDDQRRLIALASRSQRRFGWSLNEAAKRLALQEGRSHEAIRQVLLKAGGERSAMGRGDRRRRAMLRASLAGTSVAQLAKTYDKSPASVRRIVNEEHAAILRGAIETLEAMVALEAPIAPTEGSTLDQLLQAPEARKSLRAPVVLSAGQFVEMAESTTPPKKAEERATGRAMRSLVNRAARTTESLASSAPSPDAIDKAQTDLRWATLLTGKLVRSQRGFLLNAIEARLGRPLLELPASLILSVHKTTMQAAIAAAWRFDPSRGGRLAASTGLAADRALANWLKAHVTELPRGGGRAKAVGALLEDWSSNLGPWQRWLDPNPRLVDWIVEKHSSERGATVEREALTRQAMGLRLGFFDEPPMTRRAAAERLGVSQRRLGTLEREARAAAKRTTPG